MRMGSAVAVVTAAAVLATACTTGVDLANDLANLGHTSHRRIRRS
eukprot:COSAG02_NODE_65323_length_258_cov_0.654088_1_plen_44_part_10